MSTVKSFTMSNDLRAAIKPLAEVIATATGRVWDCSRDAFALALVEFPVPEDASKAVKAVIVEEFKVNSGSARGYLNTLCWLVNNGHAVDGLKMGEADALRYPKAPKAPKLAKDDHTGRAAALVERAKKELEKGDAAAAEAASNPRKAINAAIAIELGKLDDTSLSLVAAEIVRMVAELTADAVPVAEALAA